VKDSNVIGKLTFQDASEENSSILVENIMMLKREREKLLEEIKELKKIARSKIKALKSEVAMLREDREVLKELLTILNHTTDQIKRLPNKNKTRY